MVLEFQGKSLLISFPYVCLYPYLQIFSVCSSSINNQYFFTNHHRKYPRYVLLRYNKKWSETLCNISPLCVMFQTIKHWKQYKSFLSILLHYIPFHSTRLSLYKFKLSLLLIFSRHASFFVLLLATLEIFELYRKHKKGRNETVKKYPFPINSIIVQHSGV